MSDINALDLAFVVDTTGSMGSFIQAAQKQMLALIEPLAQANTVQLRLAFVEYRDHPPQDQLIYRCHDFTDNLQQAHRTIKSLSPNGGGDTPEAVFDGLVAATRLSWRPHARRLAILVGDAPPHGVGYAGDGFARGCPCGETIASVTARAEEAHVTVHALGLTTCVQASFGQLSRGTGGSYFAAGEGATALKQLQHVLHVEFGALAFDRQVLTLFQAQPRLRLNDLAERLETSRPAVSAALSRLGTRGLLV